MSQEHALTLPLILFVRQRNSDDFYDVIICSPHNSARVAKWATQWRMFVNGDPARFTDCGLPPLLSITYAEPQPSPSEQDLICYAGRNEADIWITETVPLPCFLSEAPIALFQRVTARIKMHVLTWGETIDFRLSNAEWTESYRRRVASGESYLKPRIADYQNEKEAANNLSLAEGDCLPVNASVGDEISCGCLTLGKRHDDGSFDAVLFMCAGTEFEGLKLRRIVHWSNPDGSTSVFDERVADILEVKSISDRA